MSQLILILTAIFASYSAFELFLMAKNADKERRPCVILQVAAGFGFCLWLIFDKSIVSTPTFLAVSFIALDRLQTRISNATL